MATVLVTGGTGVLGTHLVRALQDRGHDVRALSRSARPVVAGGASPFRGDVRSGSGLDDAVHGADCVVHAATSPFRRARATEVEGTANVLQAASAAGVAHLIYVSIVGVDAHRLPYYRAKWAAEQLVEQATTGWTVQRFTQFHELIDRMLALPVSIRTRRLSFQPLAATDAAERLADLVDAGPAGRAPDVGGPEVLTMRQLATQRHEVTGRRTVLVPLPPIGPLRDSDAGVHLAPEGRLDQGVRWRAWLEEHRR